MIKNIVKQEFYDDHFYILFNNINDKIEIKSKNPELLLGFKERAKIVTSDDVFNLLLDRGNGFSPSQNSVALLQESVDVIYPYLEAINASLENDKLSKISVDGVWEYIQKKFTDVYQIISGKVKKEASGLLGEFLLKLFTSGSKTFKEWKGKYGKKFSPGGDDFDSKNNNFNNENKNVKFDNNNEIINENVSLTESDYRGKAVLYIENIREFKGDFGISEMIGFLSTFKNEHLFYLETTKDVFKKSLDINLDFIKNLNYDIYGVTLGEMISVFVYHYINLTFDLKKEKDRLNLKTGFLNYRVKIPKPGSYDPEGLRSFEDFEFSIASLFKFLLWQRQRSYFDVDGALFHPWYYILKRTKELLYLIPYILEIDDINYKQYDFYYRDEEYNEVFKDEKYILNKTKEIILWYSNFDKRVTFNINKLMAFYYNGLIIKKNINVYYNKDSRKLIIKKNEWKN